MFSHQPATATVQVESGGPVVTGIVNAVSRSRGAVCSPGAIASIKGRWLTDGATFPDASGRSNELTRVKVWSNGSTVPILLASPSELHILCPNSISGAPVQFIVQTNGGLADQTLLQTTARAATPAIFSLDSNSLDVQPAITGDQILIYASGVDRLSNISIQLGEIQVAPESIAVVPMRSGLFRVAFVLPDMGLTNAGTMNIGLTGPRKGELPQSLPGDAPDGSNSRSNVVKIAIDVEKG